MSIDFNFLINTPTFTQLNTFCNSQVAIIHLMEEFPLINHMFGTAYMFILVGSAISDLFTSKEILNI